MQANVINRMENTRCERNINSQVFNIQDAIRQYLTPKFFRPPTHQCLIPVLGGRDVSSTITQQVVKNVLLDSERSYRRKVRETILAYRMEQTLTKEQILAMYLNHIYLGHGRYGPAGHSALPSTTYGSG